MSVIERLHEMRLSAARRRVAAAAGRIGRINGRIAVMVINKNRKAEACR